MTDDMKHGLIARQGLTLEEVDEIAALAELCNQHEGLNMRLNLQVLRRRPVDEINDFLYYEHGSLIGYLALFCFNNVEAEISGMVHPEFRRRGIFTRLSQEAEAECQRRGVSQMLFIVEHASQAGQQFVQKIGAELHHSEYKMDLATPVLISAESSELSIRAARDEDGPILNKLTQEGFEVPYEVNWYGEGKADPSRPVYVAERGQTIVGKIDINLQDTSAMIYGFVVAREYRGKGYGRYILSRVVQHLWNSGYRAIALEVIPENSRALNLYRSCDFRETAHYDYYGKAVKGR